MIRFGNKTDHQIVRCGQGIESGEYYSIQETELNLWRDSPEVIADLAIGDCCMNDGQVDFNSIESIHFLLGEVEKDQDNAAVTRIKYCTEGWHLHQRGMEFETATFGSLIDKKINGSLKIADWPNFDDATLSIYDSEGNLLESQESCSASGVLSVVNYMPSSSIEIIGGRVYQKEKATSKMRGHVVVAPQIPAASGGCKVMVSNLNFEMADNMVIDGRTVKRLDPIPGMPVNEIRIAIEHNVGVQHRLLIALDIFEA